MNDTPTTHFGYKEVPTGEKVGRVREVFDSVPAEHQVCVAVHQSWQDCAALGIDHLVGGLAGCRRLVGRAEP